MTRNISYPELQQNKITCNVLVAPLDWGLGHATRCIPLIKLLVLKGCRVYIAADGAIEKLLRVEFPTLEFIQLPGYQVRYSKNWLLLSLIFQLVKLNNAIKSEHLWLKDTIIKYRINWVISDNRYGLGGEIPCTFITHQLQVPLPFLLKWAEKIVQKKLYRYINKFNTCWIPDLPDNERGLSGRLGHPLEKPSIPVWYTGWQSRFQINTDPVTPVYTCLIVLSGPEPQRTLLEKQLVKQLVHADLKLILVRGLTGGQDTLDLPKNITIYNHLPSSEMIRAFSQSEYLLSRSGYSTVMDAFTMQKKCIFIPTPGQTEQEYIGKILVDKGMALVYPQSNFNFEKALKAAINFTFHFPLNSMNNLLEMAVDNFLNTHLSGKKLSEM